MKLVDLLARELESWPDRAQCIVQDFDGEVKADAGWPVISETGRVWIRDDSLLTLSCSQQSDDHSTAIVTREMWQAARAKLKGDKAVAECEDERAKLKPKANKDGWIRHRGGKCPVEAGQRVDYRMRNGKLGINERAELLDWGRDKEAPRSDIMAYRVVEADKPSMNAGDTFTVSGLIDCGYLEPLPAKEQAMILDYKPTETLSLHHQAIGRAYRENPLSWRDRIRAIDQAAKDEETRHCAAMDAYDKERAELVEKLAGEGLALIDREEVVEQEDMSDPENWLPGDLLTFTATRQGSSFTTGKQYELDYLNMGAWNEVHVCADDQGDANGWRLDYFKWHSRPAKE